MLAESGCARPVQTMQRHTCRCRSLGRQTSILARATVCTGGGLRFCMRSGGSCCMAWTHWTGDHGLQAEPCRRRASSSPALLSASEASCCSAAAAAAAAAAARRRRTPACSRPTPRPRPPRAAPAAPAWHSTRLSKKNSRMNSPCETRLAAAPAYPAWHSWQVALKGFPRQAGAAAESLGPC